MEDLYAYRGELPKLQEEIYIAPGARVIGRVALEKGVSIWYNTVLRGDVNYIQIGEYSNIQDSSVIHVAGKYPTILGKYVSVGHRAVIHACTIEDYCLIGMGAIILDGAQIGEGSIVGAGALVTKETIIPPFSLVLGAPAKVVRSFSEDTREERKKHAERYFNLSSDYR